ncbi:MAG: nucleoside deaminase [Neptuniibacter sp.]
MSNEICPELDNLRLRVAAFRVEYENSPDKWPFLCCELALSALEEGNYGVGAVLVDQYGEVLSQSANQVFSPRFDSSAHAEMKVLDDFESNYPDYTQRESLTLYVSLEPCPMCSARILASGIGTVVFLCSDQDGGMMSQCNKLPKAWQNISQLIDIKEYNGEKELIALAHDLANAQIPFLRRKLMAIIRP